MRPSEAFARHRDTIREIVAASRLENPRLFGSTLHGDDVDGSDLDILVDAPPQANLFDLANLQIALEENIGVAVDVRTPEDLLSTFRGTVLAEAQPV